MTFFLSHSEPTRTAEANAGVKPEYVLNEKLSEFLDKEGMETGISLAEARKRYGFTDCQDYPELVCANEDTFEYLPKVREKGFVFGFFDKKTGVLKKLQKRIGVLERGFDTTEFSEQFVNEYGLSGNPAKRHLRQLLKAGKKVNLGALNFTIVHHDRAAEVGFTIQPRYTPDKKCYKSVLIVLTDKGPAPHQNLKNQTLKLTEAKKKDIKASFELAIRLCRGDVEDRSNLPGKPLELEDLFVGNLTAYPRWEGPYLGEEYYKYIDLFSVETTKESDSYGRPYWDYEVIEK